MYKISEFSRLSNIPIRTLRFYDQSNVLKPGFVDDFTGYRYYTDDNLIEARLIRLLKSVNFTLDEIIRFKGNYDIKIIEGKKREILNEILDLNRKYRELKIIEKKFKER